MDVGDIDTEQLVQLAREGDPLAKQQLLIRHRERLRRMLDIRMDQRLVSRVDPSDLVQETMADAARRLPDYLRRSPLPFYPWLRRLAQQHLADVYGHHFRAQKRSVTREVHSAPPLPDESVMALAAQVIQSDTSPSQHVVREEMRDRVHGALRELEPNDREVLVMRYLEHMTNAEIAATLDITAAAVNMRHVRALQRIHDRLGEQAREYLP